MEQLFDYVYVEGKSLRPYNNIVAKDIERYRRWYYPMDKTLVVVETLAEDVDGKIVNNLEVDKYCLYNANEKEAYCKLWVFFLDKDEIAYADYKYEGDCFKYVTNLYGILMEDCYCYEL